MGVERRASEQADGRSYPVDVCADPWRCVFILPHLSVAGSGEDAPTGLFIFRPAYEGEIYAPRVKA